MPELEAGSAPASDVSIDNSGMDSAPTPSADTSQLSDDELLDRALAAEGPAETEGDQPEVEAKPVAETPETEAKEEEPAEEPDSPVTEPENLKRVFKSNPELRRAYFAEKAYREAFPTVAEAKEIRALFPAGAADAKRAMQQAELLLAAEHSYLEQPDQFLSNLNRGNPEAFKKFVSVLPKTLYDLDRDTYVSTVAEPAVKGVLFRMGKRAEADGNEELANAVQAISDALFGDEAERPQVPTNDPRLAELDRLRQESEERRQQTVRDFDASVQRRFMETLDQGVDEMLAKLAPSMPEGALARVKDEIVAGVITKLTANQYLSRQAAALQRGGRFDAAHLDSMIELLSRNAKPLIPATVKAVMSEWTSTILSANERQRTEAKKSAERKDIGAGNGSSADARPKQPVRDSKFYATYSDDDILEKRHLR